MTVLLKTSYSKFKYECELHAVLLFCPSRVPVPDLFRQHPSTIADSEV